MPLRKPRRQTLQELSYPPVPAIGGKDLRADERLLGLSDWEIGDNSTRYPQSLLSSSVDGSRWGGSTVGGSVVGSRLSLAVPSSVGAPSTMGSPLKSGSELGSSPTRSEATHHVKRKKPPSLNPEPSTVSSNPSVVSSNPSVVSSNPSVVSSNPSVVSSVSHTSATSSSVSKTSAASSSVSKTSAASSSVSKTSVGSQPADGVVRPGDIVPPDWSAAALSVVGSVPASTPAPAPAPAPAPIPAPASVTSSPSKVPPTSYKAPPKRRTSQPPPSRGPHSHAHSHSQPVISVPSLPPIAASPRSTIVDASLASGPTPGQVPSVPPLRTVKKSSTLPPQGPPPVQAPQAAPTNPPQTGSSLTLQAALRQEAEPPASSTHPTQTAPPAAPRTHQPPAPKPTGAQLLQVPPPTPYGFSSQPAPVPAPPASVVASSVSESQLSSRSSRSPRALPAPPAQSTVSAAPPPVAQHPAASIPRGTTAINTWRSGVVTSGPRGWGMPPNVPQQFDPPFTPAPALPPVPMPVPHHYGGYQTAPPPPQSQYQQPPALPAPARSYSYESPTGGFPLPNQIATNLDGYISSPDVSGGGGGRISPDLSDPRANVSADDGRPGIQRAPSKLRRKLTKSKGWHPNAPDVAAPALSDPAPAPVPAPAPAPSQASALGPRTQLASRTLRPPPLIPSGGEALVPAQRAFIGTHRSATERMLWGLPLDRDPRVRHAISKIEGLKDSIVTFGAEQFIETKMRGAVICNADYRAPGHPDDLAFDWITYRDAQKTLEPTLQKAITRTDPTSAVLVVVFLLSPSLNSLAIWRKTINIAPGQLSRLLTLKVERIKRETANQEQDMALKLGQDEVKPLTLDPIREEPSPVDVEWTPPAVARNVLLKPHPSISREKRFFFRRNTPSD